MFDQRRSVEPRHRPGSPSDIVAAQARKRDRGEGADPDAVSEGAIVGDDRLELRLIVSDQIHLVHGEHDVANADQVGKKRMPPRLRQHALARVDQDHREIGGRCAGDHVAGILFMPWRVGDDELALFRREEAIGDVDRNSLLTFGGKAIDQQREIDFLSLAAGALRIRFERGELILEDHLRIVEQPPDQRRFAVVHRAASDEPKHGFGLMDREIAVDVLGDQRIDLVAGFGRRHQKYPSCFFFSMLAAAS